MKTASVGVCRRRVVPLAREKRTAEILALYSGEINKYPDEQGAIRAEAAMARPNESGRGTVARLPGGEINRFKIQRGPTAGEVVSEARTQERIRARLSRDPIEKMNDGEIETWSSKFANSRAAGAREFEAKLYLGLYTRAHDGFLHNLSFVEGLLTYYVARNRWDDWRRLMAEYYFESKRRSAIASCPIRQSEGKLREYAETPRKDATEVATAKERSLLQAVLRGRGRGGRAITKRLVIATANPTRLYPNTPEFADRPRPSPRSSGKKRSMVGRRREDRAGDGRLPTRVRKPLHAGRRFTPSSAIGSARAAELERLIQLRPGDGQIHLDTAISIGTTFNTTTRCARSPRCAAG